MSEFSPSVRLAVAESVALVREVLAERSIREWDEAVLAFEVQPGMSSAGVAYMKSRGDLVEGVYLDLDRSYHVAQNLISRLSVETGSNVTRVRVTLRPDWSATIEHLGPSADFRTTDHLGVWSDEPGYEGPVYPEPEMVRADHWDYVASSGETDEPNVSLGRIRRWMRSDAPAFAELFRSGATKDELDGFAERLGVTLPVSLRAAWSVHDGQDGDRGVFVYDWLSMEESVAELAWFGREFRPDAGRLLIPVLRSDDWLGYVESGGDGPLWMWQRDAYEDYRLVDSFGGFLHRFADQCDQGEVVVEEGLLQPRNEIFPD